MTDEQIQQKEEKLLDLTSDYCAQELDEDYLRLCEKLVRRLGAMHDVPFKRGKLEIWAAAVVYALGSINFLFDKSFEPYVPATRISEYFGTKKTTVANKARKIQDMFNMHHFCSEFSTQKMTEESPRNKFVMVDGFIVPLTSLPEDMQKMVREARARGEDVEFYSKDT